MIYKKKTLAKNLGYYFPLFNVNGFKSTITPNLLGDIKFDYHHYVTEPISELGLYESLGRHVIIFINNEHYYLSGKGSKQQDDLVEVTYGPIYQTVKRSNSIYQISVKSFVPYNHDVELHQVNYRNISNQKQNLKVIAAPLLYGRSLDNLFDHRHVTSLLNRASVIKGGILLKPTLSFDERGHILNDTSYYFLTNSSNLTIDGYYPSYDEFVDGGSMLYPKGLNNKYQVGAKVEGYETLGGVSYEEITVEPDQEISFYMAFGITKQNEVFDLDKLCEANFNVMFEESSIFYENYFKNIRFSFRDNKTSDFLNFIEVQPVLRRMFGNSYLPHHDYGKGGRGWRDLFQDLLFMIINFDRSVRPLLINNFKGVRIDGSNATIIGNKPGEFKSDRNNITRIWSDHAVWPLLAINDYINYFNDYDVLMEKETYFDDQFTHLTKQTKDNFSKDNLLKSQNGVYEGTILEHLILQNIVGSFNLGEKGFIRLEDADWNDGLDMASKRGETIAFTHFYINNLKIIIKYLKKYETVELFSELGQLILSDEPNKLSFFLDEVADFKGEKKVFETLLLIEKINQHINLLIGNLKNNAFMTNGVLQSYVDNDGNFLDQSTISLTGQAMALLNKTLTTTEASKVAEITKKHLYNESIGGFHLNENFEEIKMNMGRAYGFRYNHKENGAIFSHMALMYAYGLYNYGLTSYAHEATYALINQAMKDDSNIPLGIPEYFTEKGQGKYFYLTGSATWLLKVLKEKIFGLEMIDGKLIIKPQMLASDFINGKAVITTKIFNNLVKVEIYNQNNLDYRDYQISKIVVDGKVIDNVITQVERSIEVYLL